MKQWDKINWPALNRRASEIEASFWRWSPVQDNLKENGLAAPVTLVDPAIIRALMVWCDDGGLVA